MILTREHIDSKFYYKIYIMESPSIEDISEDKREGDALFAALKLCDIDSVHLPFDSIDNLVEATTKIVDDVNTRKNGKIPLPYIHLSLHGNESGVGISDGNFISWNDLRIILMEMNHKVNFGKYDNKIVSRFSLCMSTCKGIYAYKMFIPNEQFNPFWSLVGPKLDIEWADSLIGYLVFYHSLIYKRTFITEAVKRMNLAIGSECFKNFLDLGFAHIEEKQ